MALDLELRKSYLGGTDLVAISGLSEYKKPGDVWLDKMGVSTFTGNAATEWGTDLEPIVAMRHGRRFGVELVELPPEPIYHPEYPFIAANLDRIYAGRKRVLECKTAAEDQLYVDEPKWGEDGVENAVPIGYYGQTNHYIGMMGFEDAYLSAMFLGKSRIQRDYPITFDAELYDLMIQNGVEFWNTYVLTKVQPPVEMFSAEVAMKAVALKAGAKKDVLLECTPQIEEWARRLKKLSKGMDILEAHKKLQAARIAQWMADQGGTKVKHSLGSFTFRKGDPKPAETITDYKKAWEQLVLALPHKDPLLPVMKDLLDLMGEVQTACTTTSTPAPTEPTLRPYWAR